MELAINEIYFKKMRFAHARLKRLNTENRYNLCGLNTRVYVLPR